MVVRHDDDDNGGGGAFGYVHYYNGRALSRGRNKLAPIMNATTTTDIKRW